MRKSYGRALSLTIASVCLAGCVYSPNDQATIATTRTAVTFVVASPTPARMWAECQLHHASGPEPEFDPFLTLVFPHPPLTIAGEQIYAASGAAPIPQQCWFPDPSGGHMANVRFFWQQGAGPIYPGWTFTNESKRCLDSKLYVSGPITAAIDCHNPAISNLVIRARAM